MGLLVELVGISFAGVLFFRMNVWVFFPFLIWLPALGDWVNPWWVIGLAVLSIASLWKWDSAFSRADALLGVGMAFVGLFLHSVFWSSFSFEWIIFPVLCAALLFWFVMMLRQHFFSAAMGVFWLAAGFWLVHERVIPLLLPAFFLGWFGQDAFHSSFASLFSHREKMLHALLGCAAGLLPGLGPGLLNVFLFSGRVSPVMGVSNLVFSLGLFIQTGQVRSVFAAALGNAAHVSWLLVVVGIMLGLVFVQHWDALIPSISIHIPYWTISLMAVVGLGLLGGFLPVLVWAGAFSLRQAMAPFRLASDAGVFILLPSILIFYFPFF